MVIHAVEEGQLISGAAPGMTLRPQRRCLPLDNSSAAYQRADRCRDGDRIRCSGTAKSIR